MPQKQKKHSLGLRPKILLTGGHAATPAIAVVEEIKKRYEQADIYWIGSKYALPGARATTVEYKILPELGVKFYPIVMGKLQTKFTRYTLPLLLNIPISFIQSFWILTRLRPDVILSFGGFSSFPVIFWGFVFRIPVVLHEQTVAAGRAAIASGRFASKIALARSESLPYFPKDKTIITGNPIMSQILEVKPKDRIGNPPVVLVMGGSRGSQFINEEILKIADTLIKDFKVVHVTGETNQALLTQTPGVRYKVLSFIDPRRMGKYYEEADIIVSRAGANSVSEIMFVGRPAILIPLPRTYAAEQEKNARFAEKNGGVKVMEEHEVNPERLLMEIKNLKNNWAKISEQIAHNISPDVDSSQKLVNMLEVYLS